jgi:phosphatidylethanolamine/phosphatidyl-N-methylethanolamine N-methyltransferase
MNKLDAEAVRTAYRRQAAFYDDIFGRVSRAARFRAIDAVNALPGEHVLEVGVGTGLALPHYSLDIAAVMFVASVVPNPRELLAELKRVVRPGGHILFVNHFVADKGLRLAVERAMTPFAHALGWHPDFAPEDLFDAGDMARAAFEPMPPFGIFTLVNLPR